MKFHKPLFFILIAIASSLKIFSHPMPNSILILDVKENIILSELKIPLNEMQFAVPFEITRNTGNLTQIHFKEIEDYLIAHIHPQTNGEEWTVRINNMRIDSARQEATGIYTELTVNLTLTPPNNSTTRNFKLYYDAVVHQLVTHKILVAVRQDFDNGKIDGHTTRIGYIYMDPADNTVVPLEINLDEGNMWAGFKSMFRLGIEHIAEGTDHLLFLLVLLLSAPMIAIKTSWTSIGTTKYSLVRLIKIVTAFTAGHSLTLMIAASGLLNIAQQPIEILIGASILITAIHAVRPIFPNKEIFIAAGFGLIHGLAFASVITDLHLETARMILSVAGFNAGIEIMQLFVVLLTFPWLLILSQTPSYKWVRITGATLAGLASLAWIIERVSQNVNTVSLFIQKAAANGKFFVLALACITIANHLMYRSAAKSTTAN